MKIACIQFECGEIRRKSEFFDHTAQLLEETKKAKFVLLPELWTMELQQIAGDLTKTHTFTEEVINLLRSFAVERRQCVVGTCVKKEDGWIYNAAFAVTPESVYEHKKTHLFGFEKMLFSAGNTIDIFEFDGVRFGITICYEVEFPEIARVMSLEGVELLLCPSYTIGEHGYWRVRLCCGARAVENQMYVAVAFMLSSPVEGLEGYGRSAILSPCEAPWNPNGVVAEADEGECVVITDIDFDLLRSKRTSGVATTLKDRRSDMYEVRSGCVKKL